MCLGQCRWNDRVVCLPVKDLPINFYALSTKRAAEKYKE